MKHLKRMIDTYLFELGLEHIECDIRSAMIWGGDSIVLSVEINSEIVSVERMLRQHDIDSREFYCAVVEQMIRELKAEAGHLVVTRPNRLNVVEYVMTHEPIHYDWNINDNVQIAIVPMSERQSEYANSIGTHLRDLGFIVNVDDRHEKIGVKIVEHRQHGVPFILTIGDRDVENNTVHVQDSDGKYIGRLDRCALVTTIQAQNENIQKGTPLNPYEVEIEKFDDVMEMFK